MLCSMFVLIKVKRNEIILKRIPRDQSTRCFRLLVLLERGKRVNLGSLWAKQNSDPSQPFTLRPKISEQRSEGP